MFESQLLFPASNENGDYSDDHQFARMVARLGAPPEDYLHRFEVSRNFFENSGIWKGTTKLPELSLESSERQLEGENKWLFCELLRKMLQCEPEKRHTAKQLLTEPWLNG